LPIISLYLHNSPVCFLRFAAKHCFILPQNVPPFCRIIACILRQNATHYAAKRNALCGKTQRHPCTNSLECARFIPICALFVGNALSTHGKEVPLHPVFQDPVFKANKNILYTLLFLWH